MSPTPSSYHPIPSMRNPIEHPPKNHGSRIDANHVKRAIQSHAPRNIQAGHLNNMDWAVEHFRQQHLKDEERKAIALAQKQE